MPDPVDRSRDVAAPSLDPGLLAWVRQVAPSPGTTDRDLCVSNIGAGRDSEVYEVAMSGAGRASPGLILKLHRPNWAQGSAAIRGGGQHARNEFQALTCLSAAFAGGSPRLAVPRPIGLNPDHAALLMEKCAGEKLQHLMHFARFRPPARKKLAHLFRGCGEWLAAFHTATGKPGDAGPILQRVESEFRADLEVCRTVGLDAELADAAGRYFQRGRDAAFAAASAVVGRHCDFAPYNVLATKDRVTVIDFEGLQDGILFDDLCYFLAMVEATPSYHLGRASIGRLCAAFIQGYERETPLDRRALHFFMIAAMVKIMAGSPVLRGADGRFAALKRRQRLEFYRRSFAQRLR